MNTDERPIKMDEHRNESIAGLNGALKDTETEEY